MRQYSRATVVLAGFACLATGLLIGGRFLSGRAQSSDDIRRLYLFVDTALHAIERSGQAPDWETILAEGSVAPAYAAPPNRDAGGHGYIAWGDRKQGEPLVIATPGPDRQWARGFGEFTTEDAAVGEQYLRLAAALTRALVMTACQDGNVLLTPAPGQLALYRHGDDVVFFVDVALVASFITGAQGESNDADGLYRRRLCLLREALDSEPTPSATWSPLAAIDVPPGGVTQVIYGDDAAGRGSAR